MERCTLCGGKLAGGRCTECGLDNTKNDRKYHLNVHNEKVTMFHRGKCEDNLNRDNDKAEKSRKSGNPAGKESNTGKESKAQRAKKLKERRQTGTVKKKSGAGRLVRWLVILAVVFEILVGVIGAVMEEMPDFFEEGFGSFMEEIEGKNSGGGSADAEALAKQKPARENWDKTEADYFESELTPGIYNIGYELPAGRYQLYCAEGTAWINWWNPEDEYSSSIYLLSEADQEFYMEDNGRCDYFELSEVLELREGAVIYVESCEQSVTITGQSSGALMEHKPQNLPEEILLKDGMTVGEDFLAGVYDVAFMCDDISEGEYASAFLSIKNEENGSTYFVTVDTEHSVFYRFPFKKNSRIELEIYGEEADVKLIPSY